MLVAGSVATDLAAGGMLPVWGAILAGAIYDKTGSYNTAFILFIGVLAVLLLLLLAIRHPDHAQDSVVK